MHPNSKPEWVTWRKTFPEDTSAEAQRIHPSGAAGTHSPGSNRGIVSARRPASIANRRGEGFRSPAAESGYCQSAVSHEALHRAAMWCRRKIIRIETRAGRSHNQGNGSRIRVGKMP